MECKADERHLRPSSSSSSMDSCGSEPPSTSTASSSGHRPAIGEDLGGGTDLRLGLSLQRPSCSSSTCIKTDNNSSGPCSPRSALTTTAAAVAAAPAYERASSGGGHGRGHPSLFVKVSMEGVPIGRKVDLLLLDGYDGLVVQLRRMFMASVTITYHYDAVGGGGHDRAVLGEKQHARHRNVLTYEDKEGDWMMVGDVPWELFLTSVKKLRIVRADKVLR